MAAPKRSLTFQWKKDLDKFPCILKTCAEAIPKLTLDLHLLVCVLKRATVLDDKLCHGGLNTSATIYKEQKIATNYKIEQEWQPITDREIQ